MSLAFLQQLGNNDLYDNLMASAERDELSTESYSIEHFDIPVEEIMIDVLPYECEEPSTKHEVA